ncbi:MAG: TRAP transporter TatT component family protein [Candidatus Thiodiazotropha sp.]
MSPALLEISERWAILKFDTVPDQRREPLKTLAEDISHIVSEQPDNPVALVWHAVVLSTLAKESGDMAGLRLAKQAKRLLEQAESIDPGVLDGSIYTVLGSLYYQVPGYPLGFGDDEKAEQHLLKALQVNPENIDANFYYGKFLLQEERYQSAIMAFEKVLALPIRVENRVADTGLKRLAEAALSTAKERLQAKPVEQPGFPHSF